MTLRGAVEGPLKEDPLPVFVDGPTGNVAIGDISSYNTTVAPVAKLEVDGDALVRGHLTFDDSNGDSSLVVVPSNPAALTLKDAASTPVVYAVVNSDTGRLETHAPLHVLDTRVEAKDDHPTGLQITAEAGELHLKAGADGYVQSVTTVTVPAEADAPLDVSLSLFPEPKKNGFHGIGAEGYVPIKPAKVKTIAPSKKSHYHGIKDRPSAVVPGGEQQRFVFRTSLGLEELSSFEEVSDAFGEIVNMLSGSFKNEWVAEGNQMDLSIPTVIREGSVNINSDSGVRSGVCVRIDDQQVDVGIHFEA